MKTFFKRLAKGTVLENGLRSYWSMMTGRIVYMKFSERIKFIGRIKGVQPHIKRKVIKAKGL